MSYNGFIIRLTPVTDGDSFAYEWVVTDGNGALIGCGYCACESDARDDAQDFIHWRLENESAR